MTKTLNIIELNNKIINAKDSKEKQYWGNVLNKEIASRQWKIINRKVFVR